MPANQFCTGETALLTVRSGSSSSELPEYIVRDKAIMPMIPRKITLMAQVSTPRSNG